MRGREGRKELEFLDSQGSQDERRSFGRTACDKERARERHRNRKSDGGKGRGPNQKQEMQRESSGLKLCRCDAHELADLDIGIAKQSKQNKAWPIKTQHGISKQSKAKQGTTRQSKATIGFFGRLAPLLALPLARASPPLTTLSFASIVFGPWILRVIDASALFLLRGSYLFGLVVHIGQLASAQELPGVTRPGAELTPPVSAADAREPGCAPHGA